jgi:hypothetical protein
MCKLPRAPTLSPIIRQHIPSRLFANVYVLLDLGHFARKGLCSSRAHSYTDVVFVKVVRHGDGCAAAGTKATFCNIGQFQHPGCRRRVTERCSRDVDERKIP